MKFLVDIKKLNRQVYSSSFFTLLETHTAFFKKMVGCLLIILIFSSSPFAQTRKSLESKRKQLISDIKITNKLLAETGKKKESALNRYTTLQTQISKREELIKTVQEELEFTNSNLTKNEEVILSLSDDINRLKEEYAIMARKAMRHKMTHSKLLFILSADNFNDAFQRWHYIKTYDAYRKKQAHLIVETQKMLERKGVQLNDQKIQKENLLATSKEQQQLLNVELKDKIEVLKTLRSDESRLRSNLAKKQKAHQKLNSAIEGVIRTEVAANRKEARSPAALNNSKSTSSATPVNTRKLTNNFSSNKGRLPWPVEGVVTGYFGTQAHPTLKKIKIKNNGIDIRASKQAAVKSVFKGEVVATQFIPGFDNMIIIKHGNYYTVYSKLEEVFFKKGDQINAQETIGILSYDPKSSKSELHFEVWRDKLRLNPKDWVR